MKKLLFNLTLSINPDTDASSTVDAIEALNNELIRRGYSANESVARSAPASKQSAQGPLELHWCKTREVRGVRRTDGRSSEEQAEYNLRTYLGYGDEEIKEILDNALVADIQNTENSGQSGVVHDDSGEEDIVESSLF